MGLLDLNMKPVANVKDIEERIKLWEMLADHPELIERWDKAHTRLSAIGEKIRKKRKLSDLDV